MYFSFPVALLVLSVQEGFEIKKKYLGYSLDRVIPPSSTALWLYIFVVWPHSAISS